MAGHTVPAASLFIRAQHSDGVQHIFAAPKFLPRWPSEDHRTRIVFIAQGVPRYFPARLLAAIEAEVLDKTDARRKA